MTACSEVADPYHCITHGLTRRVCRGWSRKQRGTSATFSSAMPFLVVDFGVGDLEVGEMFEGGATVVVEEEAQPVSSLLSAVV
eukprot:3657345-Rhodomonas_salina.4